MKNHERAVSAQKQLRRELNYPKDHPLRYIRRLQLRLKTGDLRRARLTERQMAQQWPTR